MSGYLSEIWRLRHFWYALVRVDLQRRYRGSVIGIGWSLLQPIAMTVVLCVVFSQIFHRQIEEFAPFLLSGLTFWGFVCTVVTGGCQCFFQSESYIRQQPAPLAIYPLRTTLAAGFHFLLGMSIVMVFVWWTNGFGNVLPLLVTLIPTLLLLFVIGWSVAACMGVANVMFQDSQHLIEVFLQIAFYVTPILYSAKDMQGRRLPLLLKLNPLTSLLDLIREPLLYGQLPSSNSILISSLTGLVALSLASLALYRFEKRMIFYL